MSVINRLVCMTVLAMLTACGGTGDSEEIAVSSDAAVALGLSNATPEVITASPSAVADLIAARAKGAEVTTHWRVIENGEVRPPNSAEMSMETLHIVHDRLSDAIVATGMVGGRVYTQEISFIDVGDRLHMIRDLYPDTRDPAGLVGRGIPVALDDGPGERQRAAAMSPTSIEGEEDSGIIASLSRSSTLTASSWSLSGVTMPQTGVEGGLVKMGSCGGRWDGYRVVNDSAGTYPWTIKGASFGSAWGSVTVAGRSAKILSWSPTQITIDPTAPTSWAPMSTTLVVKTAAGVSGTYGVRIVPAIKSRVFGQCTHYVALQRINMKLQPSPTAYDNYKTIGANYVPTAGDQFQWSRAHTAIVLNVSKVTAGSYTTYTLTVGEQNAKCDNAISSYKTIFETRATSSGLVVTQKPKSSSSRLATSETLYYR